MRNVDRFGLFGPTSKGGIILNLLKRYLLTILLIIIAVIFLARNMSNSTSRQVNYWEYYQHGFEQAR